MREDLTGKVRSLKQPSLFERFTRTIQKSLSLFQKKGEQDIQLIGRIQELNRTSKEVLQELVAIKGELQIQVDPLLFSHIESVVDPLIRDISKIQATLDNEKSPAQQVHVLKRYNQWIEKARAWIKLKNHNSDDKIKIIDAVMNHLFADFLERIERDLQVIRDYQHHMLENLAIEGQEVDGIRAEIEKKVEPYLNSLHSLKQIPNHLSVKNLPKWKENVDRRRQKYFDGALFAIDRIVQSHQPESPVAEEHGHLVEIFTHIAQLEEQLPQLHDEAVEATSPDLYDEERIAVIESRLGEFEETNRDAQYGPAAYARAD